MSEMKEYLILLSALIVPVGFSFFEKWFAAWFNEIDADERNKLSSLWHAVKYWTIVLATLNIFWAHQLTEWFQYIPLMAWFFWFVFDLWWNYTHRKDLDGWVFYPGNGKGGFIESAVFWLSKVTRINFAIMMIIAKAFGLGVSVFIILQF